MRIARTQTSEKLLICSDLLHITSQREGVMRTGRRENALRVNELRWWAYLRTAARAVCWGVGEEEGD